MPSNYKRLGDFIEAVNRRNHDGSVSDLRGLSLTKEFRISTSNIIGTDMSTYKIMHKNEFAANFMGLGILVDKSAIVLKKDIEPNIVSGAYPVFKIVEEHKLLPEYLMMWFRRSEFDRYCVFKSDKGIRGGFDWDDLCDCMLPIPNIEKQQEIVREYNTIQNRIALNNQLISKLEETAQAIYKQWFVEFEFPDENGKPFKSNGGKMVWCEEVKKEIPEGWFIEKLGEIIDYKKGYAFKSSDYTDEGNQIIRVSDLGNKYVEISNFYKVQKNSLFDLYKVKMNDFIITTVGSWPTNPLSVVGKLVRIPNFADGYYLNQNMVRIRFSSNYNEIVYQQLIDKSFSDYLLIGAQGSANQASITLEHIFKFKILIPKETGLNKLFVKIYNKIDLSIKENHKLEELKDLLLAKMTRVERESS